MWIPCHLLLPWCTSSKQNPIHTSSPSWNEEFFFQSLRLKLRYVLFGACVGFWLTDRPTQHNQTNTTNRNRLYRSFMYIHIYVCEYMAVSFYFSFFFGVFSPILMTKVLLHLLHFYAFFAINRVIVIVRVCESNECCYESWAVPMTKP